MIFHFPAIAYFYTMQNNANPYFLFSEEILKSWKDSGVECVKVVELETGSPIKFFELIPDPDFPSLEDTIYDIDAEDITELVEPVAHAQFVVHEVYLDMEEEEDDED